MLENKVEAAQKQLVEERRRLERLRVDYATIMRSRFHALRVLWFSLKATLGFASRGDRYAVWSVGVAPSFERASRTAPSFERAPRTALSILSDDEVRLVSSWKERVARQPLAVDDPLVTVVIPVYNALEYTVRCLQSIVTTWFESLPVQVIVVDDGSTDRTSELLAALPGLDFVRSGSNQGFVRACNRGAALARGKYICFLNNDTVVKEAWLDHLVSTAEGDQTVGVVGAKLIYPDGRLQEAGSIIWRDATGWNYGRLGDPDDSRYNYVRDIDYCSGAALLARRDLFEHLGGFSETYEPAYYEDADLCLGIQSLGYRVVYQPRAEVIHYEGVTSGTDLSAGMKQYQEVNRPKFRDKWSAVLEEHFENAPELVPLAARRLRRGPTILVVDSYVPMHDRDAGSNRLFQIIRILTREHYHVIFLPDNYAALQPYTHELQQLGVEVLHHVHGGRPMPEALDAVLPMLDLAWICRPELFSKYEPLIRRNGATKVIYDTIDLHFMRKRRECEILGGDSREWQELERVELSAAARADATIVVTESERSVLAARDIDSVYIVPTLHDAQAQPHDAFHESSGILFIGGYNHTPNVDAVKWLCADIMPRVWERDPGIMVTLLGSDPTDSVLALEAERVRVVGWVRDVTPYFTSSRVFVAPLRYGAGMNGKVGHALSFCLPTVLTTIAADGFGLSDGQNCLIADDAHHFAEAILRAYSDEVLWNRLSASASDALAPFQTATVAPHLVNALSQIASPASRAVSTVPMGTPS